jgi:hypothetical protein
MEGTRKGREAMAMTRIMRESDLPVANPSVAPARASARNKRQLQLEETSTCYRATEAKALNSFEITGRRMKSTDMPERRAFFASPVAAEQHSLLD